MQQGSDYMMRQVPSYSSHPAMESNPELQAYYDEPPIASQLGPHARSPFHSAAEFNPNFRNSQPSSFAEVPYMPSANPYENLEVPRNSDWLEKTQRSNKRSKYIVIGSVLTLAVLIGVGVALGVILTKKNDSSSSSGSAPTGTNPNDPSDFPKNPALKQSFWGISYTPVNAQLPNCGATLEEVIEDMQLLSQLTTNLRMYGADCNQSSLTLAAIQATKVNMSVWLANYPEVGDNGVAYERQKGEIQTALEQFGTANVAGILVGNEYILDSVSAAGETDPNGPAGDAAATVLIGYINDTKNMLSSMNLNLPVASADAGGYINTQVLENVNGFMCNDHSFFANQSIQDAAGWTWEFFETQNVQPAESLSNKPQMYIGETGWPTGSSTTLNPDPNDGPSIASVGNLQIFIDNFICQATRNQTYYYFFEYMDQAWQGAEYGGVEGYWGLFDDNKNFKNLTIPTC